MAILNITLCMLSTMLALRIYEQDIMALKTYKQDITHVARSINSIYCRLDAYAHTARLPNYRNRTLMQILNFTTHVKEMANIALNVFVVAGALPYVFDDSCTTYKPIEYHFVCNYNKSIHNATIYNKHQFISKYNATKTRSLHLEHRIYTNLDRVQQNIRHLFVTISAYRWAIDNKFYNIVATSPKCFIAHTQMSC